MLRKAMRVLLVQDNVDAQDVSREILKEKYDTILATSGADVLPKAIQEMPDLILLDNSKPNMVSLMECEKIRANENTKNIPVIFLTENLETDNIVKAYSAGADDVIAKPFVGEELFARIESKFKRFEQLKINADFSPLVRVGNLKMDIEKMNVSISECSINFSSLEFQLLRFFLENREKVINRSKILKSVWGATAVTDRTVDTHVVYLRKKLENFDHEIATIYGAGYSLRPRMSARI